MYRVSLQNSQTQCDEANPRRPRIAFTPVIIHTHTMDTLLLSTVKMLKYTTFLDIRHQFLLRAWINLQKIGIWPFYSWKWRGKIPTDYKAWIHPYSGDGKYAYISRSDGYRWRNQDRDDEAVALCQSELLATASTRQIQRTPINKIWLKKSAV